MDERSYMEIRDDIHDRLLLLGKIIMMRKITYGVIVFCGIFAIYNFIKWYIGNFENLDRAMMVVLWMILLVISVLIQDSMRQFIHSLKCKIKEDQNIINKF